MTLSIAARCPRTGMLGIAIALTLLAARGGRAVFTGHRALPLADAATGEGAAVAGNLLAGEDVLPAMLDTFGWLGAQPLGDRLVGALEAGVAKGGEAGPLHSAGLLLTGAVSWPVADLRVDWDDAPAEALAKLWEVWRPQMDAYVARALDPETAPAFGVPGDRQ